MKYTVRRLIKDPAFALDPTTGVGYAYVTSKGGTRLSGDPRDVALRNALYSALPAASAEWKRVA